MEEIEKIFKDVMPEGYNDIPKFCKLMSEKIKNYRADILLKLMVFDDEDFQKNVCNSHKRPFFCLRDEGYFIEKLYYEYISNPSYSNTQEFKRKFLFYKDYQNELDWEQHYLETFLPRMGVILEIDGEEIRFAMTCPRFDSNCCIIKEMFEKTTYRDLMKKEKYIEED